jgi:AcrR family transcriptional regulator
MAKCEDRRIQRTRQSLRTALFTLVREKGFETVSVQEIADRANVGRTTFYAHFDNKEELLLCGFDALDRQLRQRQREAHRHRDDSGAYLLGFSRELFEHADDHRDVFHALVGRRSGVAVQHRLRDLLVALVRDDVKSVLSASNTRPAQREALVQFIAGAFLNLLIWWLDATPRQTPEEIDRTFRQLALPALRSVSTMQ